MSRIVGGSLALALGLSVVAAEVRAQDKPATPAEQYKAILKESQARYNASHKEFVASAPKGGMPSDEKRMEFVGRAYRIKYEQAPKLVDLAEKYPNDPIALDALIEAVWQVNTTPWPVEMVGRDEARPRAFALLRRDHIRSDKLGPLCERISYGLCAEYETFLREVLEKNPHKEVRAQACLALAHFLSNRSLRLDLVLGAAGAGPGIRGPLRQGVPRRAAAPGPHQGRGGGRGPPRAGHAGLRRREAARRRDGRREGRAGAVRHPPPVRRQGGAGHRGRGPGRREVQAQRLPRQGGAARLLVGSTD